MPRRRPTRVTSTAPTAPAFSPETASIARGEGLIHSSHHPQQRERGIVITTDAARHTYRVQLNSGRVLNGVSRVRGHAGDLSLLEHGTVVRVDFSLGRPYIDGVLPLETAVPLDDQPEGITDTSGHGGQDQAFDRNLGGTSRAGGEPNDVIPGDFVGQGPDGSVVAALGSKVALLRGSQLAQVRAYGDTDTVEVIAGLHRLVTWMGEARYVNDGGKTSYQWRGGADQVSQSGPDEENFTVRLDVGDSGNLFRFEVTTPDGVPLARIQIDPQGHGEFFFAGGLDQHFGSSSTQMHPQNFHGERNVQVEGEDQLRVSGDVTHQYQGSHTVTVSQGASHTIGQDYDVTVNRQMSVNVGDQASHVYHGPFSTEVTNGNMSVQVDASNTYTLTTQAGDMIFQPGGNFLVTATNDDQVRLTNNPSSHATKFEELQNLLSNFLNDYNQKMAALSAATYPVSGSTAGPSPALANLATPLNVDWTPAKSRIVKYT